MGQIDKTASPLTDPSQRVSPADRVKALREAYPNASYRELWRKAGEQRKGK